MLVGIAFKCGDCRSTVLMRKRKLMTTGCWDQQDEFKMTPINSMEIVHTAHTAKINIVFLPSLLLAMQPKIYTQ